MGYGVGLNWVKALVEWGMVGVALGCVGWDGLDSGMEVGLNWVGRVGKVIYI